MAKATFELGALIHLAIIGNHMIADENREHADIHPHSHSASMKQVWCQGVLERGFAACRQDDHYPSTYDRRRAAWKHPRKRGKPCGSDKFQ
jgi:hypothetical protein